MLDLTVVIPCHNDTALLHRLLDHLNNLKCAQKVIVVDDGSSPAVTESELDSYHGPDCGIQQLTLLRQSPAMGAGTARNIALDGIKSAHVMFMDADDLPTRELPQLCKTLAGKDFDFCLFQHHDSRMGSEQLWGQMPFDQDLWAASGHLHQRLQALSPQDASLLVRTANYPWNKIYRTNFLRTYNIRCSETLVHNDIELHWRSFFHAKTILTSNHVCMTHFVNFKGKRLTNRKGAERLQVFVPLQRLAQELKSPDLAAYRLTFFQFSLELLLWARSAIADDFYSDFASSLTDFINEHISRQIRNQIQDNTPQLWQDITHHLSTL